ncbi:MULTISPECIES: hypothetical protein [Pseudomonas]|uniref:Uncharacterized protein n=2 Tax=Pseudomonas TaxID=286 RepID=A0A2X2EEQ1_PSELU|nr:MULTISPECIES: hypothetical protein [Pseudomonas]SER41499.1 hypothetical protein SAMN05216409_1203 [Pseudomonas lutea]SPZ05180.1 Uncharacterised protein [Pseudomonas luteola]
MSSRQPLLEAEMLEALGLVSKPVKEKPARNLTYTLVELSVRKKSDSHPYRLECRSRSISTVTAQIEAEKSAREEGLEVLDVIKICQVSD